MVERPDPYTSRGRDRAKKIPPCGGTFSISLGTGLTVLVTALILLSGVLALAARILLLLAGLLPPTLLLAGFLPRFLVLLARILVLAGHRDLPLLNVTENN
jgi:hypothetical protein